MADAAKAGDDFLDIVHGPPIEVVVGPGQIRSWESNIGKRTWHISKALLSAHSTFFRAACSGNFKEGVENRVTLAEDRPFIFEKFVQTMHRGNYTVASGATPQEIIRTAIEAWIFGDRIGALKFADAAMGYVYDLFNGNKRVLPQISPTLVKHVLGNTAPNSKLASFFIDLTIQFWGTGRVVDTGENAMTVWYSVFDDEKEFRDMLMKHTSQQYRTQYVKVV